jgi:hypothetical protein
MGGKEMEENKVSEQMEVKAQAVETEENLGATKTEISLGKFKDVSSLLKAYNNLQAEFTKRCQRIKELEGANKIDKADSESLPTPNVFEGADETKREIAVDKNEIVKEYLKEVIGAKQTAVILGGEGVSVKTPVQKPTTIEQAGMLAKQIF